MPIPIDERKKPAQVKVHVSSNAGVDITWNDGHASHFEFAYLRDQCPCALCNDEREKKAQFAHRSPGAPNAPELPMFKPKLKARAARPIGNYALQIEFTDGHTTGIYSFDYLRTMCPCADCAREFRSI